MNNLLKNTYNKAEDIKGSRLALVLISTFIFFLFIGIGINYFINEILNSHEISQNNQSNLDVNSDIKEFSGIVTYLNPSYFPEDNISYFLADSQGNTVILLRASDQKLQVSEGLFVTAKGRIVKTKDGKREILEVENLLINSKK